MAGKGALVFQTLVERDDVERLRQILRPERARLAREITWVNASVNGRAAERGDAAASPGELARLREELRLVRKQLQRIESRQEDALPRLVDLHNFFGAVRGSLPYRAARKVARTLRLVGKTR